MKRQGMPAFVLLVFGAVCAILPTGGCGDENALVGGRCAPGYIECGLHCVKGTTCGTRVDAGDGSADAPWDEAIAESQPDSTYGEDVRLGNGEGGDAASDFEGQSDVDSGDASPTQDGAAADGPDDADASAADGASDSGTDSADATSADATSPDVSSIDALPPVDSSDSSAADASADASADALPNPDASDDAEAGNPCTAPLVFCGGLCIDVRADPLNCGACNVVCASQLCSSSRCVGAASGGIVYIGHDYTTTLPGTAQARVLSNAVFIPGANPLHVMSYERYANASGISHADNILSGVATQLGRTLSIRHTTVDTDISTELLLPNYDVLLVHDQPTATDGTLAALGTTWASTLTTFTLGGGVVVVLDGGTGIEQMPAFASATGLLNVSANSPVALGFPLDVTSRVDVVGIGVISPYGAGQSTVSLTTEPNGGNVVYVVELSSDAGSGAPIVVHKAF